MDFDEYQEQTSITAIYPDSGTGSGIALAYVGLGLGEAGEIQNQLKKVLRDESGIISEERRGDVLKEAGDLLWYVSQLATELGASLSDIATGNLEKLKSRSERGVIGGSGDHR